MKVQDKLRYIVFAILTVFAITTFSTVVLICNVSEAVSKFLAVLIVILFFIEISLAVAGYIISSNNENNRRD